MFKDKVKYYRKLRGFSQEQLAERLGYKSFTTIQKWEDGTSAPPIGTVSKIANLLGVSLEELTSDDEPAFSNIINLSRPAARPIPILGTICAGDGIDCIEEHDGYFFVDNSIKADYCLIVKGDSMIDVGIKNGDKAFIKKTYDYENGKIYAVVLKGENQATLKRFHQDGNTVVLSPCNPDYQTIITKSEDICVVGECVGTYHVMK